MTLNWFAQIFRATRKTAGFLLVFAAFGSTAFARGTPEIDPGTATSALTLLVGGMLLLTDRIRRK
jgi:hypothetical protein